MLLSSLFCSPRICVSNYGSQDGTRAQGEKALGLISTDICMREGQGEGERRQSSPAFTTLTCTGEATVLLLYDAGETGPSLAKKPHILLGGPAADAISSS